MAKIVDLDALKKAAQRSKSYTDESIIAVRNTIDTDIQAKQDQVDDALNTIDKTVVGAINELKTNKVDKTDDALDTENKTIVGAINELNYKTDLIDEHELISMLEEVLDINVEE
jgi:hypothetical protein